MSLLTCTFYNSADAVKVAITALEVCVIYPAVFPFVKPTGANPAPPPEKVGVALITTPKLNDAAAFPLSTITEVKELK